MLCFIIQPALLILPAEHWWWAGSRRSPRRISTETLWMETSFHGIRCRGRRGTLGTSPRRDREGTRHLQEPEGVRCHLQRAGQQHTQEGYRGRGTVGGEHGWCYWCQVRFVHNSYWKPVDQEIFDMKVKNQIKISVIQDKQLFEPPSKDVLAYLKYFILTVNIFVISRWEGVGFFPKKLHE